MVPTFHFAHSMLSVCVCVVHCLMSAFLISHAMQMYRHREAEFCELKDIKREGCVGFAFRTFEQFDTWIFLLSCQSL